MRKLNNKGSALIVAYVTLYALVTLSAGLVIFNFNDMNYARRYFRSAAAFWLAESGANMFMADTTLLDTENPRTIPLAEGTLRIRKDDKSSAKRKVTVTATVKGVSRKVQLTYPPKPPQVFRTTISVGGDVVIKGNKVSVIMNDRIRMSGKVVNEAKHSNVHFEDKQENFNSGVVTLKYPDLNSNGVPDEFDDFVIYNRDLLNRYQREEVLYIKGNGTYTLAPGSELKDKKIVFIEGDKEGKGNAVIQLNAGLVKDQELTVIATGNVTYNQGGWAAPNSKLNIISWSGYSESAILPGSHNGMVFTHGVASFTDIFETSVSSGGLVANGGLVFEEIWSTKTFNFADMTINDLVPLGFEGLLGGGSTGYTETPDSWRTM